MYKKIFLSFQTCSLVLSSILAFTACSTEDSYDEPQALISSEGTAVGFGSYLGRAATRGGAYLEPSEIALNGGIGVYAMYTQGKKYDPTDESAETKYSDNFMENIQLGSSLTEKELQTTDADVASNWVYAPVRYWPNSVFDYLSFMAYAPYDKDRKQLYDKDGNTTGDLSYIKHTVAEDPQDQIDLLYADPAGITNMQLYRDEDSKWKWADGNTFSGDAADATPPKVELNFKHATSRIGFVVTSSALKSPLNFSEEDKGAALVAKSGGEGGLIIEVWAYPVYSNTNITVNKVMFLGDNSSAESGNPKGSFYPSGYLNLATSTAGKLMWSKVNTNGDSKLAFTFDNTDTVRTVSGTYYEKEGAGRTYRWQEGNVTGKTEKYKWLPDDKMNQKYGNGYFYIDWGRTEVYWRKYLRDMLLANYSGVTEENVDQYVSYYWNKNNRTYTQIYSLWEYYVNQRTVRGELNPTNVEGQWEDEAEIAPVGNSRDDYMFIIPQDFTDGSGNELWVYLDYTVNYVGNSGEAEHVNYKVYRQLKQKFEAGKAYIVVMDIGKKDESTTTSSFNSVNFTVQLDPWANEVNTDNINY